MMEVTLLGTGGMVPLPNRYLTALAVRIDGSVTLIDCGEGTQMTMKLTGLGYKQIDIICLTHFHADHVSGLPGLLLSMANSDKTEPLTIIGPKGVANIVNSLCVIAPGLTFPIKFIELPFNRNEMETSAYARGDFEIKALPLNHRVPCFAYSLEQSRKGKFDLERAKALPIPVRCWNRLQHGENVEVDGVVYTPDMVMGAERKGLKLTYCTDTRPFGGIADFARDSDLFICEGLYGDNDKLTHAKEHSHMIFSEAAALARDADAALLWLTHYSPAMVRPSEFIKNATDIFANTLAGKDRMTAALKFEDDEID